MFNFRTGLWSRGAQRITWRRSSDVASFVVSPSLSPYPFMAAKTLNQHVLSSSSSPSQAPDTQSPLIPLDNLVKETVLAPSYRPRHRDSVLSSPIKCQRQCGLRRPAWCFRAAKPQHLACCWDSGALGHPAPDPHPPLHPVPSTSLSLPL